LILQGIVAIWPFGTEVVGGTQRTQRGAVP